MGISVKDLILKSEKELLLFHLLGQEELELVIPYLEVADYPKDSIVFKEGEPGDFLGFITSGLLEVKKKTEFENRQVVIALLGKGSFVGEISMAIHNQPRTATVKVMENAELVILRREGLDALAEKYPYIALKIYKGLTHILATRLDKAIERFTSIF